MRASKKEKLILEDEINHQHKQTKSDEVIQPERFIPEDKQGEYCKYYQRHDFLDDLQLPQVKRTAEFPVTYPVCRNLEGILNSAIPQLSRIITGSPNC
jgi:hypothetical protein